MADQCPSCLDALAQHEAEVLLAIEASLCRQRTSGRTSLLTLRDVALFEVADPTVEAVPLNAAWDLGTLEVSSEGIRFESDVRTLALPADDVRDIRVAGYAVVLAVGRPRSNGATSASAATPPTPP